MDEFLTISTSIDMIILSYRDIVHITSDGNYSTITIDGGDNFTVSRQLGYMEKAISGQLTVHRRNFVRIGKSLIVNVAYITYVNVPKQTIVMYDTNKNKYTLTASHEAVRQLKTLLEKEYGNGNK